MKLVGEVVLGIGGGIHTADDFQNLMGTFLSRDACLVKFS